MGTPASSDFRARSNSAFDFGRSSTNYFCSRCIRDDRRERSVLFMAGGIKDKPRKTQRTQRNTEDSSTISSVSPCVLCGGKILLKNVSRQILVLHNVRQHLAHIVRIDGDMLAFFLRSIEAQLIQYTLHDGMQPSRSNILRVLVDPEG